MMTMKLGKFCTAGLTAIALCLASAQQVLADRRSISPGASVTVSGTSGGTSNSGDCGWVAAEPNLVLDATEDLLNMRIAVQTAGAPTLLIEGPAGRYCVLPETPSGSTVQFSGYGPRGTYNIYVGDRQQAQHPYTLSVSDPQR
ncbi:hypothetical protein [Lyngbya sp. CCY1209]|uniref:hypothetical protein n=1 Tax=Lyngbya sp. CCY1209 TaxID=2886103 RepID=UPI002D20E205|nr:hypothetical protein [Lyngbya sp. CCY1209]MEB3882694.1 hypothetical protein [Lyngbya sp. CCY1209]